MSLYASDSAYRAHRENQALSAGVLRADGTVPVTAKEQVLLERVREYLGEADFVQLGQLIFRLSHLLTVEES